MFIGTHALLPVCGGLAVDGLRVVTGREPLFSARGLWIIAFFGVLPDLCSPHLSLEARFSSLSHTLGFLVAIVPFCALAGMVAGQGGRLATAIACWAAAALHLGADAISGGIAWLQPWKPDVIGSYLIHPRYWIGFDAFFMFATWFLVRLMPRLEARRILAAHSLDAS